MSFEPVRNLGVVAIALASSALSAPALAQDAAVDARIQALEDRIDTLEAQNRRLIELLEGRGATSQTGAPSSPATGISAPDSSSSQPSAAYRSAETADSGPGSFVGIDSAYSFRMLDVAENVDTKPLIQLRTKQAGGLTDRITLSGGITVIADYQISDTPAKFGYLTRHPTSGNQVGKHVSEAVIHSAALAATAA